MTSEESAVQVDWRSNIQEPNAITEQPTLGTVSPDAPMASDAQPETSMMQLSAVLIIILAGMATTFAVAAIIVTLVARG
jgi:hypothetical protein